MKKITLLIFLTISSSFFAQNIITNGDFQLYRTYWVSSNAGIQTYSGNRAGKLKNGQAYFYKDFNVEIGKEYDISFSYKWDTATTKPDRNMTMNVKEWDSANGYTALLNTLALTNATDFTTGSLSFTSTNTGVLRLSFWKGSSTRTFWLDDVVVKIKPTIIWDGSSNNDWDTPANWDTGLAPVATDVVSIPKTGITNFPTAAAAVTVDKIVIESGASLIANSTVASEVIYNAEFADTNWHLISVPVSGEENDSTWDAIHLPARGAGDNRGMATYQNGEADLTTGPWVYLQAGATGNFNTGIGYSMKRANAGAISFTGTLNTNSPVTPTITQGAGTNWNLIGNPYSSNMDIALFLSTNATAITDAYEFVYVWDPTSGAEGAYTPLSTGYIQIGQAFFVNSNVSSTTVSITDAMQSHNAATFYKSSAPTINLSITNGESTKTTEINYLEGKTKGLDPRFDAGLFDGVSSDLAVYTQLLENNEGISFTKQALPNSDLEAMVIPVGVKAEAGKQITFSAETLNLPSNLKVFLEDRQTNTFTRLDEANSKYEVTLSESLNGVGRFYIHTTAKSALNIDKNLLESVSVYKLNNSTLRIAGLSQGKASVKLFNILGKQVLNSSFENTTYKDITLPNVAKGIYIVQLETENGSLNKKIILE